METLALSASISISETFSATEKSGTVSDMENNRPDPVEAVDAEQAAAALADIDRDQRAVRDTPWPLWLYPVNSILLTALGLSFLLPESGMWVTLLVAFGIIGANLLAGRANGVPFALPTSRAFLGLVALSGALLLGAHAAVREIEGPGLAVVLSVAAGATYAVGCWVHRRSTVGAAT